MCPDAPGDMFGIVPYGLGCATPKSPGVYGEVNNPSIHDFITSTVPGAATSGNEVLKKGKGHKG